MIVLSCVGAESEVKKEKRERGKLYQHCRNQPLESWKKEG